MSAREAGTAMCVGERRACNMDSQSCWGEGEKLVGAVGHLLALDMILWKNRLNRMFDKV